MRLSAADSSVAGGSAARRESNVTSKGVGGASVTHETAVASPPNILPHDEIKKICQDYDLTRRTVYEIHS